FWLSAWTGDVAASTVARSGTVDASMTGHPTLPGPGWKALFRRLSRGWSPRALELHGPVRFPGPSGVGRGGLLPPCGRRRDVAPGVARPDLHAVDDIVRIEGAGAVLEAADDRGADRAEGIALVEPPDGPLAGLRIEGAQGDAASGAGGGVEDVVLD